MKQVSRQRIIQIRNKANGMCGAHKSIPIYKAGLCEVCYGKMLNRQRIRLGVKNPYVTKEKWASIPVDRILNDKEALAKELGVHIHTVCRRAYTLGFTMDGGAKEKWKSIPVERLLHDRAGVAKELGVALGTVAAHCHRFKLPKLKRGRKPKFQPPQPQ